MSKPRAAGSSKAARGKGSSSNQVSKKQPKDATSMAPIIVALFNHKGGVSKTTTAFNLGWALADRGHSVLLVDADPQCNLTGMTLELSGQIDLAQFYDKQPTANLYNALQPAFSGSPKALQPADIASTKHERLKLLAGHIDLATYEPELSMAHKLIEAMPVLQNLPGAFGHLLRITAKHHAIDFVLVDMSPSVGALNQNILMQSDYFIVPTSPDFFCAMAIDSLARIIPSWHSTATLLRRMNHRLTYRMPEHFPKFVGMLSQRYRPRAKKPAQAFQAWINEIVARVSKVLVPELTKIDMSIDLQEFVKYAPNRKPYELAQIADFNSLIAHSQEHATPVFALTDDQLSSVGVVLEQKTSSRDAFLATFQALAATVEHLCVPRQ